jgi:uncharacterized protein YoxC
MSAMPVWEMVLVVCLAAVSAALVALLLAVRRVALRADALLGILESDARPILEQVKGLLDEARVIAGDARQELERVSSVVGRAQETVEAIGRIVGVVAGVTRAGRLISLVTGLRKGARIFIHRYRGGQGDRDA